MKGMQFDEKDLFGFRTLFGCAITTRKTHDQHFNFFFFNKRPSHTQEPANKRATTVDEMGSTVAAGDVGLDGLTEQVALDWGSQPVERIASVRTPPPRLFASILRSDLCSQPVERIASKFQLIIPPARTSVSTPPPRLFASISRSAETSPDPRGNKSVRSKWMEAIQRIESSDLSASSCGCNSLTVTLSKMQSEPVDGAARRGVRNLVPREVILEEFHIDARLREVRQPRRQKLQSLF